MSNSAEIAGIEKFTGTGALAVPTPFKWRAIAGVAALILLAGAGFVFLHQRVGANSAVPAMPATPVTAEILRPQQVYPWSEFSGRINAVDYAEIRPQVSGVITEIHFHDGQKVKAGDILFVIDPRPYQAAVVTAEGNLATAVNNAKLAKIEVDRGAKLMQANALAQEAYDQRVNADGVARAAVLSAQGALTAARLNVDFSYVKAPISGRISRPEITQGNLVSINVTPPLLASIVSDDGVYADFEVDEQTYLDSVRSYAQTSDQQQKIPVELTVGGDSEHVYRGVIESFDNRIDPGTGTIRARARFDNADGSLVPGMFVSVRMGGGTLNNALLVPESAIGNDQSKRFVFVVDKNSKAEYRPIQLGQEVDGARVVLSGLRAGDKVILDGLQRLAPGVPVAAQAPDHQTVAE